MTKEERREACKDEFMTNGAGTFGALTALGVGLAVYKISDKVVTVVRKRRAKKAAEKEAVKSNIPAETKKPVTKKPPVTKKTTK